MFKRRSQTTAWPAPARRQAVALTLLATACLASGVQAAFVSIVNLDTYAGGVPTAADLAGVSVYPGQTVRLGVVVELLDGTVATTGAAAENRMTGATVALRAGTGSPAGTMQIRSMNPTAIGDLGAAWSTHGFGTNLTARVENPATNGAAYLEDFWGSADDAGPGNSASGRAFLTLFELNAIAVGCGGQTYRLVFDLADLVFYDRTRPYTFEPDDTHGHGPITESHAGRWIPRNGRNNATAFVIELLGGPTYCSHEPPTGGSTDGETCLLAEDSRIAFDDVPSISTLVWGLAVDGDTIAFTTNNAAFVYASANGDWTRQFRWPEASAATSVGPMRSAALQGDWLAVGLAICCPGTPDNSGRVEIFRRSGEAWSELQTLQAPDPQPSLRFGDVLAFAGDWLFVGAPLWDNGLEADQGAVFVYRLIEGQWAFVEQLNSPQPGAGISFGTALATDGTRLLVGAIGLDVDCPAETPGCNTGGAVLFELEAGSWNVVAVVAPQFESTSHRAGAAVAFRGDVMAMGTRAAGASTNTNGNVFVFGDTGAGWIQEAELRLPTVERWASNFGRSLAVVGDRVLIAAEAEDARQWPFMTEASEVGTVYLYRRTTTESGWSLEQRLIPSDPTPGLIFGWSIATDGERIVVGADGNPIENRFGTVYVFDAATRDCNADGTSDGCEVALGRAADCNHNQTPDECEEPKAFADCDANGTPDPCQVDCNRNGRLDSCDIDDAVSLDADADGIPDECHVLRVARGANGTGSGSTWDDAVANLAEAIDRAADPAAGIREIWVASGVYVPGPVDLRSPQYSHFPLRSGLGLYGGFAGTEATRDERDPAVNETVLSGDIFGNTSDTGGSGNKEDAYQVIRAVGVDESAILDGFTIRFGRAQSSSSSGLTPRTQGGALFIEGGASTLR